MPKPKNIAGAMQPLFEAVSNAIHSTQDRFGREVSNRGRITITVSTSRDKENVWATVEDNGWGLNQENWKAFTTTDTDNKIRIGGKGIGRLLWLDCFDKIFVNSVFKDGDNFRQRQFRFVLALDNQIQDETLELTHDANDTLFHVKFEGLRANGYQEKFPGRGNYIFQHLTSHFLPVFIGKLAPLVTVHVGDETKRYPDAINDIVHRRESEKEIITRKYGILRLTLMECNKVASADLQGLHFVHFVAHDRTVHSQSIGTKLGLKYFGENNDRVFHAILTGEFLDQNVNQERTDFNFEDAIIDTIISEVCIPDIEKFLSEPLAKLKGQQCEHIKEITSTYPSVAFGDTQELQKKVPKGELHKDAIYGHLAQERFRRDERQAKKIREALSGLKGSTTSTDTFDAQIAEAREALEDVEQRSLAEYVVRRKVVLDFMETLLKKVGDDTKDSAYQHEKILHSFICPLKVNNVAEGDSTRSVSPASHDLWIIDERLTFAEYFSSDVAFHRLTQELDSGQRPDVLIFDRVHGLRQADETSKVLLIEFKRPGRTDYNDSESPQRQVEQYIRELQKGELKNVRGRPVEINESTIFYCYIVADIIGKLEEWTHSWGRTADGRGRLYFPRGGYNGVIEVIGWDALIKDARARNEAFFNQVGISGKSFFSVD